MTPEQLELLNELSTLLSNYEPNQFRYSDGITLILIPIIGYFFKRLINSLDTLTEKFDSINISLIKNDKDTERLDEKVGLANIRLNNHSKLLKENTRDIIEMKTTCKLNNHK